MTRTSPLLTVLKYAAPLAAPLVALGPLGCSDGATNQLNTGTGATLVTTTPGPTIDSAAVLASVANGAYATSPNYKQISTTYISSKDPFYIAEWVSTDAFDTYSLVNPADGGAPANEIMPVGATIVRVMYQQTNMPGFSISNPGPVTHLTIMSKGPPGYDPDLGDWWFALTDPTGTPMPYANSTAPQDGQMLECHSCHKMQRTLDNDFLFGAPLDARAN